MAKTAAHGEVKTKILALMKKQPTRLWTGDALKKRLRLDTRQISNCMYSLRQAGQIFVHTERDETGKPQYAIKIPEAQQYRKTATVKKSRAKTPDAAGLRRQFQLIMNELLKLEAQINALTEQEANSRKAVETMQRTLERFR